MYVHAALFRTNVDPGLRRSAKSIASFAPFQPQSAKDKSPETTAWAGPEPGSISSVQEIARFAAGNDKSEGACQYSPSSARARASPMKAGV
jgi:hypothetical protein